MSYVYVLRAKKTNFFKIGHTAQGVESRVKQLQTGCPHLIEICKVIETDFPLKVENAFHDYLDGCQMIGEWFDVNEDILETMLSMSRSTCENYRG